MKGNNAVLNMYAKQYISAVFEEELRHSGFKCPDDKLLCWYRIKNDEIMESVIFCADSAHLPLTLYAQYESVPLFMQPQTTKNVHYPSEFHHRWDCNRRRLIYEGANINAANLALYDDSILVYASKHGNRGLYTLTDVILPYFDSISMVDDCYKSHKENHHDESYSNLSPDFADEVLYHNDERLYPFCKDMIKKGIKMYRKLVLLKPGKHELKQALDHWQQLEVAFFEDGSEERLKHLAEQRNKHLAYLNNM